MSLSLPQVAEDTNLCHSVVALPAEGSGSDPLRISWEKRAPAFLPHEGKAAPRGRILPGSVCLTNRQLPFAPGCSGRPAERSELGHTAAAPKFPAGPRCPRQRCWSRVLPAARCGITSPGERFLSPFSALEFGRSPAEGEHSINWPVTLPSAALPVLEQQCLQSLEALIPLDSTQMLWKGDLSPLQREKFRKCSRDSSQPPPPTPPRTDTVTIPSYSRGKHPANL